MYLPKAPTAQSTPDRPARNAKVAKEIPKYSPDEIINIVVGHDKVTFAVHASVLKPLSAYFDKALSINWKEYQERKFELDEEDAAAFGVFVHYAYNGTIKMDTTASAAAKQVLLVEAYLLGERRQCPDFQNAVIDLLYSSVWKNSCPSLFMVFMVFEKTLEDSPIRKLMVDKWIYEGTSDMLGSDTVSIHPDFATKVFAAFIRKRDKAPSSQPAASTFPAGPSWPPTNSFYMREPSWPPASSSSAKVSASIELDLSAAPYNANFCKAYHLHADGHTCSSSAPPPSSSASTVIRTSGPSQSFAFGRTVNDEFY